MIRRADDGDIGAIEDCIASAYQIHRRSIPDLPPVMDGIADAVNENRVWIFDRDCAVAGVLIVGGLREPAIIENVAVNPAHSGKGIGRALIEHAVNLARERGCTEISLNTHAAMVENIALYQHLGWVVTRTQGNKVSMTRHLTPD